MSKRSLPLLLVSLFCPVFTVASEAAPPLGESSRLATYATASGDQYYALCLSSNSALPAAQTTEILVLFDTSASQTGVFREDALAATKSMLRSLPRSVRVKLVAVDLDAVDMTKDFVAPRSAAMKTAFQELTRRTPLGATDLAAGLATASEAFEGPAQGNRAVIYVGDGISRADLVETDEFRDLVQQLAARRVSVSSLAIGPQRNIEFLVALANQTGGRVYVDADGRSSDEMGLGLAQVATRAVMWPLDVALPQAFTESYPSSFPPLRVDRDSILVGKMATSEEGLVKVKFEVNGQVVERTWRVHCEASTPDFSFLPRLVSMAREDGGLMLPIAGSDALKVVANHLAQEASGIAKLGSEAIRRGDVSGARAAATAAAARDPDSPKPKCLRRRSRGFRKKTRRVRQCERRHASTTLYKRS